jgi:hypothetical protein
LVRASIRDDPHPLTGRPVVDIRRQTEGSESVSSHVRDGIGILAEQRRVGVCPGGVEILGERAKRKRGGKQGIGPGNSRVTRRFGRF